MRNITEVKQCLKCEDDDIDLRFIEEPDVEYILVTCNCCGFKEKTNCADADQT